MATAKKRSSENTSKSVATKASKLLRDPKTPAIVKSVAASALTQAANRRKKGWLAPGHVLWGHLDDQGRQVLFIFAGLASHYGLDPHRFRAAR